MCIRDSIWRLPADRAKGDTAIGYGEGLRYAIGTREVLAVLAVTFLWFLGPLGMFAFVADFFQTSFELSTSEVSIVFIVLGVVGVASARTSGRFIARIGARKVVLLAITCFGLAVLVLPSVSALVPALAVFAVWVFGTWFGLPAQQSIAAGISDRARGTVMAFNSSALNLAAVISPLIAAIVFAEGGFRLLGTWTAALAVVAFVAAYVLLPRPQVAPREPDAEKRAEDCVAECAPI